MKRFTLEHFLYAVCLALALFLRLYLLGAHPLNDAEAGNALAVYRLLHGIASDALPNSPAYFFFTLLSFLVFDATDFAARLAPALAGSLLVLTPLFYRDWLGRWEALLTAALLALSAGLTAASRSADGTLLAALGLLAGLGWLRRYLASGAWPDLVGGAVAVGMAFASGAAVITGGILGALTLFVITWINGEEKERFAEAWGRLNAQRSIFLVAFGLTVGVMVTAFALYPSGLGALTGSWLAWANGLSGANVGRPPTTLLTFLVVYEPLIVGFGLVGVVRAFRQGERFAQWLAWFALIGLVFTAVYNGRTLFDLTWVIIPLTALAASAIVGLWRDLPVGEERGVVVAQIGVMSVLLGFALLNFASFAEQTKSMAEVTTERLTQGLGLPLGMTVVSVVLALVVAGLFGLGWTMRMARFGLTTSFVLLGLGLSISAGWGLNQLRPTLPVELWWSRPVADDVNQMLHTLHNVSNYTVGNETDIELIAQAPPNGALAWALRDFVHAQFVTELDPQLQVKTPIVIAPEEEQNPTLGSTYVGQSFSAHSAWALEELNWGQWMQWLAFRRGDPHTQKLVLWVRQDVQQLQSSR